MFYCVLIALILDVRFELVPKEADCWIVGDKFADLSYGDKCGWIAVSAPRPRLFRDKAGIQTRAGCVQMVSNHIYSSTFGPDWEEKAMFWR